MSRSQHDEWVSQVGRQLGLAGDEVAGHDHRLYAACKALIERPIALALAVATLPLVLLMAALAKWSSPGPAFYWQVRLGRYGVPFAMCKIRTMAHNCEAKTGVVWASTDDPRVTRIGRFLRETHLDELPQLWHVVRGHMSLIGPRPERPEMATRIERRFPQFCLRLQVRPGITGLAQVQLPADSELEGVGDKLAHDLYYARRLSPWLDLKISLGTLLYLSGLCLSGIGKLLVKSDGRAAERDAASLRLVVDADRHVGAA